MSRRLAFLTLADRTGFVIDDGLAIAELGRRGVQVDEVPWRRTDVDDRAYAGIVIRTPWDYQNHLDEFLARLDAVARAGVPLANSPRLVRWNAEKSYLRDLEARGARVVPTRFGRELTADDVEGLPAALGADECVVKPEVGANADLAYRIPRGIGRAAAAAIAEAYRGRAWLAQPFLPAILSEGEYSLFYFGGKLSHAIQKRPAAGDFRVQEEHGGHITGVVPTDELEAAAAPVLRAIGEPTLQARVDLVRLPSGELALMELEAIEPSLYFRMHPEAPARFADAVFAWLGW